MLNENEKVHYIEEPVNELINAINGSSNNIILTGARHSGKTLTAEKLMEQNKGKNVEYIYFRNCLDLTGHGLSEEGLIHMIELQIYETAIYKLEQMEKGIVERVCEKYGHDKETGKLPPEALTELRNFAELRDGIKKLLPNHEEMRDKFNKHIRSGLKEDFDYFQFGEISERVISIFKQHRTSVQVVFDRFESSSTSLLQKTILRYTQLFDKNIIIIDENTLGDNDKEFEKRGYDVFRTDYTKDSSFVREYLDFKFKYKIQELIKRGKKAGFFAQQMNITGIMTDDEISQIFELGNGDLELANSVVGYISNEICYCESNEWEKDDNLVGDAIRRAAHSFNEFHEFERTKCPRKTLFLFNN